MFAESLILPGPLALGLGVAFLAGLVSGVHLAGRLAEERRRRPAPPEIHRRPAPSTPPLISVRRRPYDWARQPEVHR